MSVPQQRAVLPVYCPQALWHILYHNEDMEYALSAARLHHQLSPNEVRLERHMPQVHTWD